MGKFKTAAVAALTLFALAAILFAPSTYLALQERLLLSGQYERDLTPVTIDPEAEEIYLVRAIRDAYYLSVGLPQADEQELRSEWAALSSQVAGVPALPSSAPTEIRGAAYTSADSKSLQLHQYFWDSESDPFFVAVHRETKTGKLVYAMAYGLYRAAESAGKTQPGNGDEAAGRAFCAYLGLDILGDWAVRDEGFVSAKASLKITCRISPEFFFLSAAPLEIQWNTEHLYQTDLVPIP